MLALDPFRSVAGLPTHVLLVHAVIVLTPLAALLAVMYLAKPTWRAALTWPTALLALGAGASAFISASSGENLEGALAAKGLAPLDLHTHTEAGDLARTVIVVFMLITLLTVFWALRARVTNRGIWGVVGGSLTAVGAIAAVAVTIYAGHTGASVAWGPIMDQLNR